MTRNFLTSLILVFFFAGSAFAHGTENKELISPADLASPEGNYQVIDIRQFEDFIKGHVPGAHSIPISELSDSRIKSFGLEAAQPIVLYGVSESSAKKAKMLLDILGYSKVRILAGGYTHWVEDGQNIEKGKPLKSSVGTVAASAPGLQILPEIYDFGVIKKGDGSVTTAFTVRNISANEIVVTEITTSCGCTSAEINDKTIPSGEESKLAVSFDPNFHKEPEGKFSRTVFLQASDGREFLAKIEVEIEN